MDLAGLALAYTVVIERTVVCRLPFKKKLVCHAHPHQAVSFVSLEFSMRPLRSRAE